MKKQPLVSVCIPTYNSSETIVEMLISIMRQTYLNIEIIISDNASTDNTIKKIEEVPRIGFSNIKVYKNKKNIGPAANNNKLIKKAKGKYVCIFHADDVYHPNIIKEQLLLIRMFPNCGVVFTLRQIIDENGKILKKIPLPFSALLLGFEYGPKEIFFPRMLEHGNFFVCPTAMVRKEVYDKVGLYKVSKKFNNKNFTDESQMVIDQDMWLRIMDEYSVGIVKKYLINYRVHLGQGSMILNRRRKTLSPEYKLYDEYIDKWEYKNIKVLSKYNKMRAKAYLFYAVNCLLDKDKNMFYENLNQSYFYCYLLSLPFNIIRWCLNSFPNSLMRYIILCTVKLLKLMRLNKRYLFINYI